MNRTFTFVTFALLVLLFIPLAAQAQNRRIMLPPPGTVQAPPAFKEFNTPVNCAALPRDDNKARKILESWSDFVGYAKDTPIAITQPRRDDQYSYAYGYYYDQIGNLIAERLKYFLHQRNLNPIAPLTGNSSVTLAAMNAENGYGRNAGVWGPHTQQTACIIMEVTYRLDVHTATRS